MATFLEVEISNCVLTTFAVVSANTRVLRLTNVDIRIPIAGLPTSLKELHIRYDHSAEQEWMHVFPPITIAELPPHLDMLSLCNVSIKELPALPPTLATLLLHDICRLQTLPALPSALRFLEFDNAKQLTTLPALPASLQYLILYSTGITMLPPLPVAALNGLYYNNTPLLFARNAGESLYDYEARLAPIREQMDEEKRTRQRCAAIKEALIARAWAPSRMLRWCIDEEERHHNWIDGTGDSWTVNEYLQEVLKESAKIQTSSSNACAVGC